MQVQYLIKHTSAQLSPGQLYIVPSAAVTTRVPRENMDCKRYVEDAVC